MEIGIETHTQIPGWVWLDMHLRACVSDTLLLVISEGWVLLRVRLSTVDFAVAKQSTYTDLAWGAAGSMLLWACDMHQLQFPGGRSGCR